MIFIELTDRINKKVLVNAYSIATIRVFQTETVVAGSGTSIHVKETPDQIEELIEQAEEAHDRRLMLRAASLATEQTLRAVGLE